MKHGKAKGHEVKTDPCWDLLVAKRRKEQEFK